MGDRGQILLLQPDHRNAVNEGDLRDGLRKGRLQLFDRRTYVGHAFTSLQ
jgi:hypothetical protein